MVERVKVGELLEIVELWPGLYTAACCWRTLALSAGEEGCCGHQVWDGGVDKSKYKVLNCQVEQQRCFDMKVT